jgi:hypothetical protein
MHTTIHRGHLHIDFTGDGSLCITHEQQGISIMLSKTEWAYIQAVAQLHGWPIVSVADQSAIVADAAGN